MPRPLGVRLLGRMRPKIAQVPFGCCARGRRRAMRATLLLSVLVLSGCAAEPYSGAPTPLYGSPASQLEREAEPPRSGSAAGQQPIELRPAPPPVTPPDTIHLAAPAPDSTPSPASPQVEAPAPSPSAEPGNDQPGDADVTQKLQQVIDRLTAEEGRGPVQSGPSQSPAEAAQPMVSSVPTRPGFREHYGGLNHSGDVPPRSVGANSIACGRISGPMSSRVFELAAVARFANSEPRCAYCEISRSYTSAITLSAMQWIHPLLRRALDQRRGMGFSMPALCCGRNRWTTMLVRRTPCGSSRLLSIGWI